MIKVKVFEGQGLMFRGVVDDGDCDHGRRRNKNCPGGGAGRRMKKTKSGTVIVATITPDKLVRFWTSGGMAIGSLDQVRRASAENIRSGNTLSKCICNLCPSLLWGHFSSRRVVDRGAITANSGFR